MHVKVKFLFWRSAYVFVFYGVVWGCLGGGVGEVSDDREVVGCCVWEHFGVVAFEGFAEHDVVISRPECDVEGAFLHGPVPCWGGAVVLCEGALHVLCSFEPFVRHPTFIFVEVSKHHQSLALFGGDQLLGGLDVRCEFFLSDFRCFKKVCRSC